MAFKDQQESLNFAIKQARDDSNLEEGGIRGVRSGQPLDVSGGEPK